MSLDASPSSVSLRGKLVLLFFCSVLCGIPVTAFSQSTKWKSWAVKGDTLYSHKDYKGAIKLYNKAISQSKLKDKDAYRTVYNRAVCYFSIAEYSQALKDIDIFIVAYPEVSQAKLLRAFIYRELGDDDQQLSNLTAAMEFREPNADLLKWRGLLYLQKETYDKAKLDLLMARNLQEDPEVETYLGLCYYNLQKKDSAIISFNKAIEIDATYIPAYLYVGSLTLEDGDYSLSLTYLNLALRINPSNKEALYYKGVALIEMEKIDEGCRCLNRAFYAGMDDAGDYLEEHCFGSHD